MAGVSSRSRQCNTCRRRKKGGCDQGRPVCGQCLARGLVCGGYERDAILVHTAQDGQRGNRPKHPKQPRAQVVVKGGALTQAAYGDNLISLFFAGFLPHGKLFDPHMNAYTTGYYLNALPTMAQESPILHKILIAFGLSTAGQAWNQRREKEEGLRCFTAALGDMSKAISQSKQALNPLSFALASRMCGIYEATYGHNSDDLASQIHNWHGHVDGELALVIASGPSSFNHGYWHQFFVDGRLHFIISALEKRKRCVLDAPEWKTIPWSVHPKSAKDLLLDIMVEMPAFLEDFDALMACSDPTLQDTLRERLRAKCWQYDERLARWRDQVGITGPAYQFHLGNTTPSADLITASSLLMLYWAICILVYSTLQYTSGADAVNLPNHTNPRLYCRRIAETVPIPLNPLAGIFGVHTANLPTGITLAYLQAVEGNRMSEEKRLIIQAFRKSAHSAMIEQFFTSASEHWEKEEHAAFFDPIVPEIPGKAKPKIRVSIKE